MSPKGRRPMIAARTTIKAHNGSDRQINKTNMSP